MGAGQTLGSFQLRTVMAFQMGNQIIRQNRNGSKGILHRGNGLIFQSERLRTAGKLIMKLSGAFGQPFVKSGPVGDQQGAYLAQPEIVFRQNLQQSGIFKTVLQNAAFLLQNPVIFRQRRVIIGSELTQGRITEPPPLGRSHFQDQQILRAEQHRGQHASQLRNRLFLDSVPENLPGTTACKQQIPQLLLPLLGKDLALDFREILAEADHFGGFLSPEAFSRSQIGNGLQQVGLSLGIVAHDQIHPRLKAEDHFPVIPEGPKRKLLQIHE